MPTKEKQQLSVFNFNGQALTVIDDGNQPWFIANEVCKALGIANNRDAVSRLDDDEKLIRKIFVSGQFKDDDKLVSEIPTSGQNRDIMTINESGLYSLTLTSNKPEAKAFKKWITSEVLPAIRKTGTYSLATKTATSPQDQFYKNHKTACLLFTDRLSRLRYANAITLEQTGVDVLTHAGLYLPDQHPALSALLNKIVDDKTIQQLLDSVHYQHLDALHARNILTGLWLRLYLGNLYISNKCPLVDDYKAIQSIQGATKSAAIFLNNKTVRATVIQLY